MKEFIINENEAGQRFDKSKELFLQNDEEKKYHAQWKKSHRE